MDYVLNMKVVNSQSGEEGVLSAYNGNQITVRFAFGEKRYYFPQVFDAGVLQTTNEKDQEKIADLAERQRAFAKSREKETNFGARNTPKCDIGTWLQENHVFNMKVINSQYGNGIIVAYSGDRITVRFSVGEISFFFPNAFETGELQVVNERDQQSVLRLTDLWRTFTESKKTEVIHERAVRSANVDKKAENGRNETAIQTQKSNKVFAKKKVSFSFGQSTFAWAIALAVLSLCGLITFIVGLALFKLPVFIVGIVVFAITGFLSNSLFNSLVDSGESGALITICLILTFIPYMVFLFFILVIGIIVALFSDGSPKKKKKWEVYDGGYKRILEEKDREYYGSSWYYAFRDDIGQVWLSKDKKKFFKKPIA